MIQEQGLAREGLPVPRGTLGKWMLEAKGAAVMESWNHSLQVEAIHGERFATRAQATAQVFEYIDVYYNSKRLHSTLGYLSPEAFEARALF